LLNSPIGYQSSIVYSIGAEQNSLNLILLERIKEYFNGEGSISKSGNMYIYETRGMKKTFSTSSGFTHLLRPNKKFVPGIRYFSSSNSSLVKPIVLSLDENMGNLNPNWISGFSDAEASFIVTISKNSNLKSGWTVIPSFQIGLDAKDIRILENIQKFFGVGVINKRLSSNLVSYSVTKNHDLLKVIIPHFEKYSLISQKNADFYLFKSVVILCSQKEHLNKAGLNKIVAIRASMNRGLTDILKKEFPNIVPVNRPIMAKPDYLEPNGVSGFISGEGCFYISVYKSKTKLGYATALMFSVSQHMRDIQLIESLVTFFNCGQIKKDPRDLNSGVYINVTDFSNILKKVLPFFCTISNSR